MSAEQVSMLHRPSRSGAGDDLRLMTRIARMYHERSMRQADIAARLHISQTKVSRLLQKAAQIGIVRVVVNMPEGVHTDLEEALENKFGIAEVVIADVDSADGSSLVALGAVAANYLESTLTPDDALGISSWSATLLATANTMRPGRGTAARQVVQMVGGLGNPQVQLLATAMLKRFGEVLNAEPVFMMTPAVLGSAQARNDLLGDPSLAEVVGAWQQLTVSVVGIGALDPSPMLAQSGNIQLESDRVQLISAGAVGDVCLHYFDAHGRLVQSGFEDRVMAIDEQTLKSVPRRIGIACGLEKLAAVRSSLLGGWINILLTDSILAAKLAES